MDESSRISIPGVILAALLHDMEGHSGDLEGFLFGSTTRHVVDNVEDAELGVQEGKTRLAIQAFVCTGRPFSFYDQLGRVVPDQLRAFCADRPHHSLIGWFKFRRNTPPRLSARELEVHAQLCQLYQKELNKDRDLKHFGFVMGLFTSFKAAEIISYDYRFVQIDGERQMRPIQLEVINIEHSPQQEYASFAPVTDFSTTLSAALNPVRDSVKLMDNLFDASMRELKSVALEVHESTKEVRKLEREIEELKRSLGQATTPRPLNASFGN